MPSTGTSPPRPSRDVRGNKNLENVLDLAYRRRWTILLTTLVFVLLGAALLYKQTPMFSASSVVMIDLQRSNAPTMQAAPDEFVRDNRSVQTELFVLNASRGIRERVEERLADEDGKMPPGSVTFALADRNVPNGIMISVQSPDPTAAADLANAYAEEYVAQTQLASRSYLTESREFLEEQAARLRGQVAAADAATESRMSGASAGTSASIQSQLSSLKAQLGEAQINRQMAVNRLASITSQLDDITPALADRMASDSDRRVTALTSEIASVEAQLAPYEQREAAGQPFDEAQAQALRARLADLQRQQETAAARYVDEVMNAGGIAAPEAALSLVSQLKTQAAQERISISASDGRISLLRQRIGELSGELGRAPSQTVALERATQDRAAASQTYAQVAQQLEQVRVQEASEPGYASVLREAQVPLLPAGPGWIRVLGIATLLGLVLGVGLAVVWDQFDNKIYKPEHVTALGVPVLEAVPDLGPVVKDVLGGAETLTVGDHDVVSELVTIHAPLSPAAETYRHLRTAIQFSRPDTSVETVLVTSAAPGEGKSTTSANLAAAFAQGGRTTVLLDTDFRRPRVHEIFGMSASTGLYQLIQAASTDAGAIREMLDLYFSTGVPDLYVVPAGALALEDADDGPDDGRPLIANPAEALGSTALRDLIGTLREITDVVVIDTPPVLVATDAVMLSTQADATVVVTSAGASKTGDIAQALSHLDDVGANVVGAVLNRFSLDKALGYAYTYGHYSRYGAYSKYAYSGDGAPGKRKKSKGRRKPPAVPAPAVEAPAPQPTTDS